MLIDQCIRMQDLAIVAYSIHDDKDAEDVEYADEPILVSALPHEEYISIEAKEEENENVARNKAVNPS